MAAVCRRTEAILAQDTEKEHGGLKDVTPGPSEFIANPALEVANATPADVPATLPIPSPARKRRRWGRIALLVVMLATAAVGSYYWWKNSHDELPRGIVSSNGRIEADEIDVATKFAGRVAELRVEEGDMVNAGEMFARMDTRDLESSLKRAEAQSFKRNERSMKRARRKTSSGPKSRWRSSNSIGPAICCNGAIPRRNCSIKGGNNWTALRPH